MFSKRLVVLLSAVLVFPSTALAAQAGQGLTGPVYRADPHEANWLTVANLNTGHYLFHDFSAGVTPGLGCTGAFAGTGADCSQADPGEALIFLDDRDDNFTSYLDGRVGAHVDGGTGNDHLTGGFADDQLSGGAGNDIADGGLGNDVLDDAYTGLLGTEPGSGDDTQIGGQGNDTIVAGPGADTIDGGPGSDTVDYTSSKAPLTVTVDAGMHDDGAPGEDDTVTNVERVLGGTGADTIAGGGVLVGGAGDDALRGGVGNDTLLGDDEAGSAGSANDTLDGGAGSDMLRGGDGVDTATYATQENPVTVTLDDRPDDGTAGEKDNVRSDVENVIGGTKDDTLIGSATANVLTGGPGNDHLAGAGGSDTLDGGGGDDTIDAADGNADAVLCGDGDDTVHADATDAVAGDCEHVDRPAVAMAAAPVDLKAQAAPPAVLLAGGTLKVDKHRRVKVTLGCSAACAGRVTLRAGGALAAASFRVPGASIRTLTLTLSKSAARRVRRGHRLTATLAAVAATTSTVAVTLTA
ncbi:calcium-binding protein [Solirubrobacter soli]|uniref:calcium-binding protein n=1 Tax=Solirubrobacter soli TaxID=363832 RepID=UPI000410D5B4|nr:calcium-binding protein [Solirubrobacter soli]